VVKTLISVLYLLTYFLALDFVRPTIVASSGTQAWWGLLGLYLIVGFSLTCWLNRPLRVKASLIAIGFVLLGCTLYLDDPVIKAELAEIQLGELRILALAATFLFIATYARPLSNKDEVPEEAGTPQQST
jgi:hypothetical protein